MTTSLSRRRFLIGTSGAGVGLVTFGAPAAGALPAGLPPTNRFSAEELTAWIRVIFAQVKAERFSPTSAARAYAYIALAAYESVVAGMPHHRSLGGQLNDFPELNIRTGHNWAVAMNEAVGTAAQAVFADRSVAARTALADYATDRTRELARGVSKPVATRSAAYGRRVGDAIAARTTRDNYLATRNLPYSPPVGPDKWVKTPPNFGAALEPHWGKILSFTMTSNGMCKPAAPIPYSEDEGSPFWNQARATYDAVNGLDDMRRQTALFWRDNPDGTTGLPAGHWMLTACLAIEQEQLDLGEASEVLVLTGLALADGFTSCWTEKYETNLVRPVTYIKRVMDSGWESFVNSPAFPEYTSGHSVGSGAAAETLTHLLGTVRYTDDTGVVNGFPPVTYESFWNAANEAALSRLYGGIHYPMGIEAGIEQGICVARNVLAVAQTRRSTPGHQVPSANH